MRSDACGVRTTLKRLLVPLALLASCAGEDARPGPGEVDLIIRDVVPAIGYVSGLDRVAIHGSNICPAPKLTVGDIAVTGTSADGNLLEFGTDALVEPITALVQAQGACEGLVGVQVRVDCTDASPAGVWYGIHYRSATAQVPWNVGIAGLATTRVHLPDGPASRGAGLLLEVSGEVSEQVFREAIDAGTTPVHITTGKFAENGTSWVAVHPTEPLAPGVPWKVVVQADRLHSRTRCIDLVGDHTYTITPRDEPSPTLQASIRLENGVVVADAEEVGSHEYALRDRPPDQIGLPGLATVVATSTTPHLTWNGFTPGTRHCLSVVVAGVPLLSRSAETCLTAP